MLTIKDYKEKLMLNQNEVRVRVFEIMARENINVSTLAREVGTSWATMKRFLTSEILITRETLDKLKEWIESYEE